MKNRINIVGKRIQAERPNIEGSLRIEGGLTIQAAKKGEDGKESLPTFTMLAYTGNIIGQGWGKTIVELSGITFPQVIPILADHDASRPVGHSTKITMTEKGLMIEGVISGDPEDESVRRIVAMGKNGFPWQASIGASIDKVEYNDNNDKIIVNGFEVDDDTAIVRASTLYETSILPLGADSDTDTQIAANFSHHFKENIEMKFKEWLKLNGFGDVTDKKFLAGLEQVYKNSIEAAQSNDETIKAVAEAAKKGSDGKIAGLEVKLAKIELDQEIKDLCGDNVEMAATAIKDGWAKVTVEAALKAVADVQAERETPAGHTTKGLGSSDEIMAMSLALGMGVKEDNVLAGASDQQKEEASSLKLTCVSDVARILLVKAGKFKVTDSREDMLRAAMTTTSLPKIFGNSGNKSLLASFENTPSQVEKVSTRKLFNDFKEVEMLFLDKNLILKPVGLNGELKHGSSSERSRTSSIDQNGLQYVVGRKLLINDDLGALQELFGGYGQGSSTANQRNFWTVFLDAGGSFYSSGNGNLLTGTPLSINGLTIALAMLESFVDSNGDPINVFGTTGKVNLIVPPGLRTYANQLNKETTVNETTSANVPKPANNPHAGLFNVIVDPYLNNTALGGGSATTWYLQATGATSFIDGRLAQQVNPLMRSEALPVGQLGIATDAVFDFGATQFEPKAIIKVTA